MRFGRGRERELDDEIDAHLRLAIEDRIAAGMSPAEAEASARREFGNVGLVKEITRGMWGRGWLLDIALDARYALRQMRRGPAFAAVAIITLGLGMGGTVAVFSLVDAMLLRTLPYRDADRIVTLWQTEREDLSDREGVAPGTFLDWKERATSFEVLAAVEPMSFDIVLDGEPASLRGALVTEGFFDALGVGALIGRSLDAHGPGGADRDQVVLGYGAWQRLFGGDPAIIGRTIDLGERPRRISGVMPPWLRPAMPDRVRDLDVLAPQVIAPYERANRRSRYWNVVGRLAPGASMETAAAELRTVGAQLAAEHPQTMGGTAAALEPLRRHLAGPVRGPLLLLFAAVSIVLVIACANVAALSVARGLQRDREFAIRRAVGAGKGRLVRQLLVESLILATLAAGVGLLLAHWSLDLFAAHRPPLLAQIDRPALDGRLVFFAGVLTLATAVFAGLWPMLRLQVGSAPGRGTGTFSPRRWALSYGLVAGEVALSVALLISAGLVVRSIVALMRVDPGFTPSGVAALQVFAYGERYPTDAARLSFFDQAVQRLRAAPSVTGVGLVSTMPFGVANVHIEGAVQLEGRLAEHPEIVSLTSATGPYFEVMGIPLRRGRLFAGTDHAGSAPVAIVNDRLAARLWPGENPLGRRVTASWEGSPRTAEIVGIVGSLRHEGLDSDPRQELFMPFAQAPSGSMTFVVRTASDPAALIPTLRAEIWELDATLPFYDTAPVASLISRSVGPRRFTTGLLAALAALGLVLAVTGIYGVLSYLTAARTRDIGVRMALGARRSDVMAGVLRQSLAPTAAGVALGVAGALAATRVLQALLFGVTPLDPVTFLGVPLMFAIVALAAALTPALRATRVDPLAALRCE